MGCGVFLRIQKTSLVLDEKSTVKGLEWAGELIFGEKKAMACLDGWGMPWYNEHEKRALPIDGSLPFVS